MFYFWQLFSGIQLQTIFPQMINRQDKQVFFYLTLLLIFMKSKQKIKPKVILLQELSS